MDDNPYCETEDEKRPSHLDNLVTREEWGAIDPSREFEPLKHIINKIRVNRYTKTDCCTKKEDCIKIVKKLQEDHMANGSDDILYNFLIGGDGNIYVGRGWSTPPYNEQLRVHHGKYVEIALIGDHLETHQSDPIFHHTWEVVAYGMKKKLVDEEFIPI